MHLFRARCPGRLDPNRRKHRRKSTIRFIQARMNRIACRPARRNLVSGEARVGKPRHAGPHLGQARHASAHQARPAVHLGLPVRRHLPGARHRRRVGHADSQYRRHEQTSGRNQQMRQRQCPGHFTVLVGTVRHVSSFQTTSCSGRCRPTRPTRTQSNPYGTICGATFSATVSGTPTRRSSTLVAMPGTPSSPNPRSSPQLQPEIGHRSKPRAVGIKSDFPVAGIYLGIREAE